MIRAYAFIVILLSGLLSFQATAQTSPSPYPRATGTGIIEALDFDASTMVVSGYLYEVAVDTRVEIGGSYGAFTMLRPGMQIRFDYLRMSPSRRQMLVIEELPAGASVEET